MVNCSHTSPDITDYIDATTLEPTHATACIKTCTKLDSTSTYCLAACPEGFLILFNNNLIGTYDNSDGICKVYVANC